MRLLSANDASIYAVDLDSVPTDSLVTEAASLKKSALELKVVDDARAIASRYWARRKVVGPLERAKQSVIPSWDSPSDCPFESIDLLMYD